jgi:hypothetical protein
MRNWLMVLPILLSTFYAHCAQAEERVLLQPLGVVTFQKSTLTEQARVKRIILELLGPEVPASVNSTDLSSESEANLHKVISGKLKTTK